MTPRRLPTAVLLERLKADIEAPWATYQNNGLTAMKLGFLLRDFDIRSDTIRFDTGQAKGYQRTAFADAWARYCTPAAEAQLPVSTCLICRQPLAQDDGSHTHPTCDPEARR